MIQIKSLLSSNMEPANYESDESSRVTRNKKARTGALYNCKHCGEIRLSIMELSATARFARSQESLIKIICYIDVRTDLVKFLTNSPSRVDLEVT